MHEGEKWVSLQLRAGKTVSSKHGSPSFTGSILERGCSVLFAFNNK